jgi:hypothetical protein
VNVATRAQRRLAQMAGLELGWRLHAGELLAWVVTALTLVMSYHAEQDLGWSLRAFRGWPSYVWPLSVDVADVALMVLYLEYKRLRLSTWKVWLGMVAATAVMIAANVRSVWPDPTAVLMEAWIPAIALWLWHTLAAGRRPRGAPVDLRTVWARVTGEVVASPAAIPAATIEAAGIATPPTEAGEPVDAERPAQPNPQARVPARAEVRRQLRRHRGPLTDADTRRLAERLAERTGVSIPHARRLLREERRPHVVADPSRPADGPMESGR